MKGKCNLLFCPFIKYYRYMSALILTYWNVNFIKYYRYYEGQQNGY